MKKLCLLLLALPFIFGFTGYGGYHEFTWPDGVVAYYNSSPRGKNSDASVWSDLSKSRESLSFDMAQPTAGNRPTITADGRTFTTNDFYSGEEVDNETGALTYTTEGADSTFTDAGQVFTTYGATGTATHRIVVHNDDATVTYGYCGAAVSATEIKVYKNISLTTTGWNGTAPAGKTPSTYEVYKVLGTTNLTGDMTVLMWARPGDGQPAVREDFVSKGDGTAYSFAFTLATSGKMDLFANTTTDTTWDLQLTGDTALANGAQANFALFGFSIAVGTKAEVFLNGVSDGSSGVGIPATIAESPTFFSIGSWGVPSDYFNGQIGLVMVFEAALTATEVLNIYNAVPLASF